MPSWGTASSVVAGAAVTSVLGLLTVVALPVAGIVALALVGDWLPTWAFAVPVVLCPVAGGATTVYLRGDTRNRSVLVGGLAAALGSIVIGVLFGLLFTLVMASMAPYQAQGADFSSLTLLMAALGGGGGFLAGAVLGALGGAGVSAGRREFGG